MLRIILLIGNFVSLCIFIILIMAGGNPYEDIILFILLIILFLLNFYFILGIGKNIYFKRKRLEEEIKIQEAENKLRELKEKK